MYGPRERWSAHPMRPGLHAHIHQRCEARAEAHIVLKKPSSNSNLSFRRFAASCYNCMRPVSSRADHAFTQPLPNEDSLLKVHSNTFQDAVHMNDGSWIVSLLRHVPKDTPNSESHQSAHIQRMQANKLREFPHHKGHSLS